jgi:hypothetical protein
MFMTFAYYLLFIEEQNRVSDQTCRFGLFISGLFAFISALQTFQQEKQQQRTQQPLKYKENRVYARDKEMLTAQLKESIREQMVSEQQKRALLYAQKDAQRVVWKAPQTQSESQQNKNSVPEVSYSKNKREWQPIVGIDQSTSNWSHAGLSTDQTRNQQPV